MGILNITIPKSGGRTVEVDDTKFTDQTFQDIFIAGLEYYAGLRMSKITGQSKLEGAELEASQLAAFEIGCKNIAELVAGEFKKGSRGKAAAGTSKIPREVMTEARRLAKEVIKNEIKAAGMKISHVEPRDITAAANNLLETDPSFLELAKANIEARNIIAPVDPENEDIKAEAKSKLASLGFAGESPKLLKAVAERKAKSKETLSAVQAGKAAPRKSQQPVAH